jgi:hypothetical protein
VIILISILASCFGGPEDKVKEVFEEVSSKLTKNGPEAPVKLALKAQSLSKHFTKKALFTAQVRDQKFKGKGSESVKQHYFILYKFFNRYQASFSVEEFEPEALVVTGGLRFSGVDKDGELADELFEFKATVVKEKGEYLINSLDIRPN